VHFESEGSTVAVTHLPSLIVSGQIISSALSSFGAAALIALFVATAACVQRKRVARTGFKLGRRAKLKSKSVRLANDGRECFEDMDALQPGNVFRSDLLPRSLPPMPGSPSAASPIGARIRLLQSWWMKT
jgi:hypothetical protein